MYFFWLALLQGSLIGLNVGFGTRSVNLGGAAFIATFDVFMLVGEIVARL